MKRVDFETNSYVGAGEDSAFEIIQRITGLPYLKWHDFPSIGLYRWLPISKVLDNEQMKYLAEFHKKSSIDIFMIPFEDEYAHQNLTRLAIRVEGDKGDLKMQRQSVQAKLLSKWCKVIDLHKYECKELFTDRVNEKSIKEISDIFKTARVDFITFEELV